MSSRFKQGLILCMILAASAGIEIAQGQNFPSEPVGHVNDFAEILSANETRSLEAKLRSYRDSTSNVLVIATLPSLQGLTRQEVANQLFNEWQMWEGDRYNGVLILIAPTEREMQIEVGYGLEGAVPDAMAGRIVTEVLRPHFQNNQFYNGLNEATDILMELAAGEFDALDRRAAEYPPLYDWIVFGFILLIFITFLLFALSKGKGNRSRKNHTLGAGGVIIWGGHGRRSGMGTRGGFGGGGFGGGGGGGGFGGFGGGGGFGSGGGGAGGGW